jgi:hypothetical protein
LLQKRHLDDESRLNYDLSDLNDSPDSKKGEIKNHRNQTKQKNHRSDSIVATVNSLKMRF